MTQLEQSVAEIRACIADEAIILDEYRGHFREAYGRDTRLSDDELVWMLAESDDDKDPADWALDMLEREQI